MTFINFEFCPSLCRFGFYKYMKMDRPEKSLDSGEKTEQPGRVPNVRAQRILYLSILCVIFQDQLKEAVDFLNQASHSPSLPYCCGWVEIFAATFPSLKGRLRGHQTMGCGGQHVNHLSGPQLS